MENNLPKILEGLLFYFGDSLDIATLAEYTQREEVEIREALDVLRRDLESRGITLLLQNDKAALATNPEISEIIKRIQKEELEGELSKSAQEVLSIILYAGPISKGYIDYIRGVNSTVSLRNLVARSLVEKRVGGGKPEYVVTVDFLMSLGINAPSEIEEYNEIRSRLDVILQTSKKD